MPNNKRLPHILLQDTAADVADLRRIRQALGSTEHQLLRRALREKIQQYVKRVFRLLGLMYPPKDLYNAYLGYVLDGHLVQQYPHYEGKSVCFRLDCAERPRGEVEAMLRAMQNFASAEEIRFVVQVIQDAPA